jgi:hypothetical protein
LTERAPYKPALAKAGDPTLLRDLEALVEPTTRGDPESPLRWTCKSVRRLAQALQTQGHEVSRTLVAGLLNDAGYSLQGNRKTKEGDSHPDRDAQFGHVNTQVAAALAEQQPVISVDTKKKELVGDFRNPGREYRPQGHPEEVRVHDFLIKELGRAVPYGVYDLAAKWNKIGVSRTHRQRRGMWSCPRDEGWPLEAGSQVQASNHCKLRSSRAMVVSVAAKGGTTSRQVGSGEASESKPLMTCRNSIDDVETGGVIFSRDKLGSCPEDCPSGIRHVSGAKPDQALVRNVRTCRPDVKGDVQAAETVRTRVPMRGTGAEWPIVGLKVL